MRILTINFFLLASAIVSIGAATSPTTAPATAAAPTTTTSPASKPSFDVTSYGAVGDGQTLDTAAIQKAIDACAKSGGGTVSIPAGTFRCGSVFLKSHVILQIEQGATLVGSTDDADYPIIDTRIAGIEMKHPAALVNAIDCDDVAVVGAGTIDGSGKKWWDLFWNTRQKRGRGVDFQVLRPRLVCFTRCTSVRVTGLSLQDSPFWTLHILYCKTVDIDGLTIRSPANHPSSQPTTEPTTTHAATRPFTRSTTHPTTAAAPATRPAAHSRAPSTDGIDIDSSSDVRISRCDIGCDDDDIAIKSGRDADGLRVNKPSENILISDCTIWDGGGISMGSETAGGIHNVTVRRCTFTGTGGAAKIKSCPGRGGVIDNITYEDITATNVASPIEINLAWGGDDWKKFVAPKFATTVPSDLGTPKVGRITLRNFTASATIGPRPTTITRAGTIAGLPNSPIKDVTFENVYISAQRGMTISNAPDLKLDGLTIDAREGPNVIRK